MLGNTTGAVKPVVPAKTGSHWQLRNLAFNRRDCLAGMCLSRVSMLTSKETWCRKTIGILSRVAAVKTGKFSSS